jgi:L-ascorbate metabolism protein UlaG (beta-lactamase superfamily)
MIDDGRSSAPTHAPSPSPSPSRSSGLAPGLGDSLVFVGNATVLLRLAGLNILTDPNFVHAGEEVPLGYGLSTRRLIDPALGIDDLPALDVVVLSHYHGDHFDRVAEARLPRKLPIVTTPEAAGILSDMGFVAADGLETWESRDVAGNRGRVRLTALPGRHAPAMLAVALPDVMGTLVEVWRDDTSAGEPDQRIYISGDTIFYEGLREIRGRVPMIDLALLHLGGTRVMGVTVTMDAEQGLNLVKLLEPQVVTPIHYDDYEAFKSPLSDFVEAIEEAGLAARLRTIERGESRPLAGTPPSA